MKSKYIISPETFYDADIELYFTHVIYNDNNSDKEDKSKMLFAFTAYGQTENESREAARHLVLCLDIN